VVKGKDRRRTSGAAILYSTILGAAQGKTAWSRMRIRMTLIVLPLLLGGWFDEPPAWARRDGRLIDPVLFQRERSICRGRASVAGRDGWWIVTFTDCMLHFGYIPLRRDILP
jgi:hypothetical protein